ncbi:DUF2924 domain-containing protein [Geothrix sp. PMB-07]|uniref:DUF2924 domain-containing protein n=1 Tax=Geothrix sp. PMB-07 TaxID=3068640 RepID=UPI0027404EDF|nr:DUF2924 domain-containing protein [Geothrix sp. PMB-07]WLT30903.1 DUF2924 domain-containing protein [Geothrix sp. PMB-07]
MVSKIKGEALSREAAVMRSLAKDIGALQGLGLAALRARYLEVYGEESRSKNLPYLRKRIAYRIQEQMEGGLSGEAKARIEELSSMEVPPTAQQDVREPLPKAPKPASTNRQEARDPRLPKAGSLVSREFRGFIHEVRVQEREFVYRGRAYRSLSAIAKEITGTPWNGFLFFGLINRGGGNGRQS